MKKKKIIMILLACSMCLGTFGTAVLAEEGETEVTAAETAGELSDDIYSFQLKLDGDVYQFPMSCEDFMALGWTYVEDEDVDISPNSYSSFRFTKGNLEAYVDLFNLGLNTLPATQCSVGGMSIDAYQFKDAPETVIEFPKGLAFNVSTLDDVKAAWGEPSDTYEGENYTELTYEYDIYQEISFQIDAETGVLDKFDYENLVADEEANAAAAAEVSGEPTQAVLAYEAPTELGDDIRSGVVDFAGNLYQLPAPVSVFIENGFTLKPEDSDAVVAGDYFGWFEMIKDGKEFRGTADNLDPNATTIENCFVTEVEVDSYDADLPLTLPGGISNHMSADDLMPILETLPYEMTSDSDDYTYYTVKDKDSSDWSINIVVNKEDNAVTTIEYEKR